MPGVLETLLRPRDLFAQLPPSPRVATPKTNRRVHGPTNETTSEGKEAMSDEAAKSDTYHAVFEPVAKWPEVDLNPGRKYLADFGVADTDALGMSQIMKAAVRKVLDELPVSGSFDVEFGIYSGGDSLLRHRVGRTSR